MHVTLYAKTTREYENSSPLTDRGLRAPLRCLVDHQRCLFQASFFVAGSRLATSGSFFEIFLNQPVLPPTENIFATVRTERLSPGLWRGTERALWYQGNGERSYEDLSA